MQQDNKPDNTNLTSIGKPDRIRQKSQESQAQEFINETDNSPQGSTAERGSQPRVKVEHNP